MSGRPLDLTQRQVRVLCEGAKKAGYVPVVKIGETLVWFVPEAEAMSILRNDPKYLADPYKDVAL
jgi:hypothetical protein